MKIFPDNMKQTTKYVLLLVASFGIAAYGASWDLENDIFLKALSFVLFITGVVGLIVELINKIKIRDNNNTKRNIASNAMQNNNTTFDTPIIGKDEVLKVAVDRDRSIVEAVVAGKYGWAHLSINDENFKIKGEGITLSDIILIHFDKIMSSEDVLKEINMRNCRPADVQELLSLGEQHPAIQISFPIIALGSIWTTPEGHQTVAGLYWHLSPRGLDLLSFEGKWRKDCRFAILRTSSTKL